ncbi:MAG: hypothetical protein LUH43_04785 [Clostridia bacterium]|nr:hypothetical protein [Clostridia bacterium]
MKKKKLIAMSLAVILAVALAAGGTLAYLSGASLTATNNVANDFNWVSLTETKGNPQYDSSKNIINSAYEIIPGTSQDKDPTVNVSYSLDSYVYVTVEDTSGGLITWDVASGWTLLTGSDVYDADGNLTYAVYYRLVQEADTGSTKYTKDNVDYYTNSFSVLDGDSISYSSSITNSQIVDTFDANGNPSFINTDIKLVFQAYIMQADISGTDGSNETAVQCWQAMAGEKGLGVAAIDGALYTTLNEAIAAAENGETVTLLADVVTSTYISVPSGTTVSIDLNGYSIDASSNSGIIVYGTLTSLTGGSVNATYYGVVVDSNGSIGELNADVTSGLWAVYVLDGTINEISGGTYTNTDSTVSGFGLYIGTDGSVTTISGGEFQGTKAAVANYGSIGTISGGTYHGTYYDGTNVTAWLPQYSIMYSGSISSITGGTFFKGSTNIAQYMTKFNNAVASGMTLASTGEEATIVYKSGSSTYTYTGEYYMVVAEGTTVVSTASALETALSSSNATTIYLASDFTLTSTLSVSSSVTFTGTGSLSGGDDSIDVTTSGVTLTFSNGNSADEVVSLVDAYDGGTGNHTTATTIIVGNNTYELNEAGNLYKAEIATADGLYAVSVLSADGELTMAEGNSASANYINLNADVDMSGYTFTSLNFMHGTFNGNNHIISNLTTVPNSSGQAGLFGYAGGVTIKDLTLDTVTVYGDQAGAFVGHGESTTITNCTLTGTITVTYQSVSGDEYWGVGSFVGVDSGNAAYTLLTGSSYSATVTSSTTTSSCATSFKTAGDYVGYYLSGTVTVNGTSYN